MIYRIAVVILTVLVVACTPGSEKKTDGQNNSADDVRKQVMEIHDEVMPKMGQLRKVEKALRQTADSVITLDSAAAQKHLAVADRIKKANEEMMSWMRQFEPNYEGTEDEVRVYLEEQKLQIRAVADSMNTSLAEGEDLIWK